MIFTIETRIAFQNDANQEGKQDIEDVSININTNQRVIQEGKEDVDEEPNMEEILPSM